VTVGFLPSVPLQTGRAVYGGTTTARWVSERQIPQYVETMKQFLYNCTVEPVRPW
jgi:hypothetical protein